MSLWGEIKARIKYIRDAINQVDIPGTTVNNEEVAKVNETKLVAKKDYVEVTVGKQIVPQHIADENGAIKAAEAKAKGRNTQQNVRG